MGLLIRRRWSGFCSNVCSVLCRRGFTPVWGRTIRNLGCNYVTQHLLLHYGVLALTNFVKLKSLLLSVGLHIMMKKEHMLTAIARVSKNV